MEDWVRRPLTTKEAADGRDAVLAKPAQVEDVDLMRSRDMSGAELAQAIDLNIDPQQSVLANDYD